MAVREARQALLALGGAALGAVLVLAIVTVSAYSRAPGLSA